jgi:hypothetical protein
MTQFVRTRWFDKYIQTVAACAWFTVLGLFFSGCGGSSTTGTATSSAAAPADHGDGHAKRSGHTGVGHSHIAPHGGQVQSVGDNHFELTFDGAVGQFTLYVLGEEESKAEPIAEQAIELQVRDEGTGEFKSIRLAAKPQQGETGGMSSRFVGSSEELATLAHFTAVARVPVSGESHRVSYQFVGGKPISAGMASLAADGFACPMACEEDKIYKQPGKCPVCKMKLEEHKAGATAHADHNPKHGGIFFMAPDNWHHLEGTLVSQRELRIYLYDNFTRPLGAIGYSGELKVQPVNDQDEEVGQPVTVPIKPADNNPYLIAELPESAKLPFQSEARLQFPKAKDRYLFNFDFKAVQHQE